MNKRHYEHTLPNIRGSLSNTYATSKKLQTEELKLSFIYDSKTICLYGKTILSGK